MSDETISARRGRRLRLYNILFPVWLLYFLPTAFWLVILPANLAIDALVLRCAMKRLGIANRGDVLRRSLLRVWLLGFLADFLGAALVLGVQLWISACRPHWDTFLFPGATLLAVPGVVAAGVLIYFLDRRWAFSGTSLPRRQIHQLSLALAVFTAPYAMLIPLYG